MPRLSSNSRLKKKKQIWDFRFSKKSNKVCLIFLLINFFQMEPFQRNFTVTDAAGFLCIKTIENRSFAYFLGGPDHEQTG